ncbi:single Ig IL-1-related receptor [Dasypus novemcinctus]|uniref:single Ig IL-1-related receptor n=1 Tax=Dasypus novemcinctus TaxID=9361 RepID=UPI00265F1217|nr:single Ig IL-1-related receptor [Dasypus novemcinctus]XP_058160845.1 single Ig IL-1-related receptor [Dasypus novemcinctus]XP_058160846.1 single Ig IL-1-related receptor [Dasypus novemcinctus]XP_058160847.1 single Ig IL-1-related receptor [Dasypus novemcinctus]XP_058160848.1 single Ig IL-1-related receptor [Dasypus novemcinctus]XP_058160849.1 single Ig IL-1-related receptor [Dasypus novemcinctus]XP_058160850.1 single Ig IL-1-related receptor [Dasypus novemcinctus]
MAGVCGGDPRFLSPPGDQVLGPALGSVVTLNCTAWAAFGPHCSLPSIHWQKDGQLLDNRSHYRLQDDSWVSANWSEAFVSSVLGVTLTGAEDYGAFSCSIWNISSPSFTLWKAGPAGHVAAVLASLLVLLALLLAALLYVKCRLNVLLWYQDTHGELEMNDGKLYDAYVSHSDCPEDRKFVHFILKPQLERRGGYKLLLDDRDLLPHAEPSADLLVSLSRCRRLVIVLSDAFLGQAWCSHSFREGLCRLLELTRRPIFITFEGQRRDPVHPALRLLRQHRHLVTLLLWKPGSVTPSSNFWKELQLALPRKVLYRATAAGDPQTQLQDDRDPMLIVGGRAPEARALELDPDPEGDLGVRGPVFADPLAPPQASGGTLGEGRSSEVDVSDLGSRNYSARTDFYCLVSEDDV